MSRSSFDLRQMSGSHAIGHTRMATESAVTTLGAHPFSTGADQCLVHNGSLSNHNSLNRKLKHDGMTFETENDSEVAAAYLTWRMNQGMNLGQALEKSLDDLDGFFTFVVGTKNGFGVIRDPIACKPAVMAETDQYVAFGSEYRALAGLPGIETAQSLGARAGNRLFLGAVIACARSILPSRHCGISIPNFTGSRTAPTKRSGKFSIRAASMRLPSASTRRSRSQSEGPSATTAAA